MKTLLSTFVIVASLFSTSANAEPPRVIDRGVDGDARFYNVVCPNDKRTSVTKRFKINEVCVYRVGDQEATCRKNWNVDDAARYACK